MPLDLRNNLRSEDVNFWLEEEQLPLKEELLEEQRQRPWRSSAEPRVANSTEEDALPWTDDTDSASSAKKARKVKSAELSDPADVVKPRLRWKESSAEESTWDGESPGWDINLDEEWFEDNTNGELLEEFEESLREEEESESDLKEEEEPWEWESSDVNAWSEDNAWWDEDSSSEEEIYEEDWCLEREEQECYSSEDEELPREEGCGYSDKNKLKPGELSGWEWEDFELWEERTESGLGNGSGSQEVAREWESDTSGGEELLQEDGNGDGELLEEKELDIGSTTSGEAEESPEEDGPGDGELLTVKEFDTSGTGAEATGKAEEVPTEARDSPGDGDGDGSPEVERESEPDTDTSTIEDIEDGSGDGDGDGSWEVERESELDIDTSTPGRPEAREPELLSEKERKLLEESEEELEESEGSEEELPDKDGELRELATHKHGGAIDLESTDGDSAEECLELKVTGTSEDTLILERNGDLETGELLKSTGENSVSKKEEISLPTETWTNGNPENTCQDSKILHGPPKLRWAKPNMLTSTTWSGVSMRVETDTELTDLPTFKPNAILTDTLTWLKDTERTGTVLETTGTEEATEWREIQSVITLKFKLISLKAQDTLLIITLSSDV